MFLYQTIDQAKTFGAYKDMPQYIAANLNPVFPLRPYQAAAFQNFITYFENSNLRRKPAQTLFHMATGSGKTLIMAGLMLYLYKQGYRNFLFFVNLSNIVKKTKENFLNGTSAKYLLGEEIVIDGNRIRIREVDNFQSSDNDAINICFTTTQGLHMAVNFPKENAVTIDDFRGQKTVLISDEAHHINVSTKMNKLEEADYMSWETTVQNIFNASPDNVLLEFTATCDLTNPTVKAKYEPLIIFDYPLAKFRADLYSKEIITLRSDMSVMERAIQACALSQYRLKVFQDNRIPMKPIVLFKAAKIDDSKQFMAEFITTVSRLTGADLRRIADLSTSETMNTAYKYFSEKGISLDTLAREIREDFSIKHCISANDDSEADKNQLLLNSLEDKDNPYRAVFEVKKLDEGWDVLNLFDIVRLYETRQSSGKKISSVTVSEAQLIGRGARYCPFKTNEDEPKYQRKYDHDLTAPLRICEELYYHCQNDSKYIAELRQALKQIGIEDNSVQRQYTLKDRFMDDDLYKFGLVFANNRTVKSRADVDGLLPSVRDKVYNVRIATGRGSENVVLEDENLNESGDEPHTVHRTIGDIAALSFPLVYSAVRKYGVFKLNTLQSYFPKLSGVREFIINEKYLGKVRIDITSRYAEPPFAILSAACTRVLGKIADSISAIEETYEGMTDFTARNIREVFKDKKMNFTLPHGDYIGISQNAPEIPADLRLDLSTEDWFVFNDNYGTSEEKAFVAYFKGWVEQLRGKYDKVFLVRNERQLAIYSFSDGERFEPDYLLFLHKNNSDGYEQLQIFIEPKGNLLIADDKWKEDFLLELSSRAIPMKIFADDNKYRLWGFHFFNRDQRGTEFAKDMDALL